jgi:FKBP-type peptidyl-prolyl cis-trans isomerase FklB
MLVEILKEGTDENAKSPRAGDSCEVTYKGTFKDGSSFDGGTTSFAPNQVIKGWTEAMQLMGEGDKWKLYIPYDLAYGERGSPPKIPPFSPLVFEIEIHKVKSGGKPVSEAREAFVKAQVSSASDL